MDNEAKQNSSRTAPGRADEFRLAAAANTFAGRVLLWLWGTLLVLLVLFQPVAVVGQQVAPDDAVAPGQMQSGSLLLRMRDGYRVATRINTEVDVRVSGPVARTAVSQRFRNDGAEWTEAVYVFPLPDGAAVDRLRMHIGERYIEGEIREKDEARKEYEQAKASGQRAGLVEQQRANLFTTSVANIPPGETVRIEIEYLETLRYDDGAFSLRFPLTLTPRYVPGTPLPDRQGSGWAPDTDRVPDASLITPPVVTTSADHKVSISIAIDAGLPLETIRSAYHPLNVSEVEEGHYDVRLKDDQVPMDHDFELTWRPPSEAMPRAMLFRETIAGKPHYLLLMLPPDTSVASAPPMPRDLVFVIDTSGSMHGTSIEQAKQALTLALDGLRPGDRFNVIQFSSVTHALFPGSVEASSGNVALARRYVRDLEANGGTEMRPALERALAAAGDPERLRQIIFITDGSVGNGEELFALIDARLGNARLFTVGIGSAPNSLFMRKAAEEGRGTFTFISALHEVREKMARLFAKLERPQVTDIDVRWPGGQALAYPETVPDLYAGEPVVQRTRLAAKARAGDLVTVSGNSPAGAWRTEIELAEAREGAGVAAVWARARIGHLLDGARDGEGAEASRPAVVQTALQHHLVSRYTSLVAVDKTPARPAQAGLEREQVPNLLPYGQSHDAIFGFPATATGYSRQLALGAFLLALALAACLATRPRRVRYPGHAPQLS
jgi:Ca-activated chloride channel homolog